MGKPRLATDLEDRLDRCAQLLRAAAEEGQRIEGRLDELTRQIDSGEVSVEENFDDPSVVRHITELRERVKRASNAPPLRAVISAGSQRTRTPAR